MKTLITSALIVALALAGTAHAQDKAQTFTLHKSSVVCLTEDGYKQMLEYANDDDALAAQKYLNDLNNGCMITSAAKTVYVEGADPQFNAVQLRVKGYTGYFWTSMNFVN